MKSFYKVLAVALLLNSFSQPGKAFPTIDAAALGGHLQALISQITNVGGANSKNEDLEQKEETVGMENRTGDIVGAVYSKDSSVAAPTEDDLKNLIGKPQESVSEAYAYVKETFFYPYTPGKARARVKREKIEQARRDYMDETILYSQELSKSFLDETLPSLKENVETLEKGKSEASDLRSGVALGTGGLFLKMRAEIKSLELETSIIEMELYPLLLSSNVYFREDISDLPQKTESSLSDSEDESFWDKVKNVATKAQEKADKAKEVYEGAKATYEEAKATYEDVKETAGMVVEGDLQGLSDKTGMTDYINKKSNEGLRIIENKVNSGVNREIHRIENSMGNAKNSAE